MAILQIVTTYLLNGEIQLFTKMGKAVEKLKGGKTSRKCNINAGRLENRNEVMIRWLHGVLSAV